MHGRKAERAFHEATVWCPGFSRFGPPEGGTPNKSRHTVRFRVPMHGKKAEEAFHEPEGRARQSPARRLGIAKLRRARSDAPYRFMVPMHGTKVVGFSMNLKVGRVSPLRAVCALPNCGAHGVTRPTGS